MIITKTYQICPKAHLSGANLYKAIIEKKWYEYIKNQNVINFDSIVWIGE